MKKIIITENQYKFLEKNYRITEETENEKIFGKFLSMVKDSGKQKSKSDSQGDDMSFDLDDNSKTDYSSTKGSNVDDNWMGVTKKVIEKFEGGYWNPVCAKYPRTRHPTKTGAYSRSGETMFGLDREAGNIENSSTEGRQFFARIDQEKQKLGEEQFCNTWVWNYIPPEPLKSELVDLAARTMKKFYDSNAKNFFKGNTKNVVESSRPLLLHFSYATWNGPGFFQKFANTINKGVEEGKSIKTLINLAKQDRINNIGGYWAEGSKRVNTAIDQEAQIDGVS